MNCARVGELLQKLRKEKNMTQKQVAESLNISDKTVSKWECGMGCPDVSLLHELSNIFGINIEKILLGDLEPNDVTGGNMKQLKFYECKECKNVITSTGVAEISCCGRKLTPEIPSKNDELHKLIVEEVEDDYYVTIDHEMTKEHFISFVAYVTGDRILLIKLYPEQNPEVRFPKMRKGKLYAFCSQHGLWEM